MVTVKKARLVAILTALGHKGAGDWSIKKLSTKAASILPEAATDEDSTGNLNPKQTTSFKELVKALKSGKGFEVTLPDAEDNGKPEKKGKKSTKESAPREGVARVGIVAYITEQLFKASKSSPLTVAACTSKVVKKFGEGTKADRPEKALRQTVYAQLGFQLRNYKGYDVRSTGERGDRGFYLKDQKMHPELVKKGAASDNGKADKKKKSKKKDK